MFVATICYEALGKYCHKTRAPSWSEAGILFPHPVGKRCWFLRWSMAMPEQSHFGLRSLALHWSISGRKILFAKCSVRCGCSAYGYPCLAMRSWLCACIFSAPRKAFFQYLAICDARCIRIDASSQHRTPEIRNDYEGASLPSSSPDHEKVK